MSSATLEGEWEVVVEDLEPLIIVIVGTTAKVWFKGDKEHGAAPGLNLSIAKGLASAVGSRPKAALSAQRH